MCPVDNITVNRIEKTVEFVEQSLRCLSFVHNCPTGALNLSNQKTESRYRNNYVKLSEIIKSNIYKLNKE